MTKRRMRIACWLTKATHRRSQYVIFMNSPLQKWLQGRASVLPFTYIACLSCLFSLHLNPLQPRPSVFHMVFLFFRLLEITSAKVSQNTDDFLPSLQGDTAVAL